MYYFQAIIYCVLLYSTRGEKCTTPIGLPGECVPLSSCPSLLWSFTNIKFGMEQYLNKFLCDSDAGLKVCCHVESDFLVFEDEQSAYGRYDPLAAWYHVSDDVNKAKLVNAESCGVQNGPVKDGILGLPDFPWLIKLMVVDNVTGKRNETVACTGVLINSRYILYTVQCHRTALTDYQSFFAKIGTKKSENKECEDWSYSRNCTTFEADETETHRIHQFYDAHSNMNDIAVLRLRIPVVFSDHVRPICLPLHGEQILPGQLLFTAGWNKTFSTDDLSVKIAYSSRLISNQECKQRLAKDMLNEVITMYHMCTTNQSSVNDMEVIGYPIMSLHNNRWYLQGFTSRGLDYKPSTPKIHTRVQNYLHWIQKNIGGERCHTPFNETGQSLHISDCPRLFDAFANHVPQDREALGMFIWELVTDDPTGQNYIMKVCCGDASNFTILVNATEVKDLQTDVSNFKYCGQQHRDDYYLDDDRLTVDEFPWLAVILNATEPGQRDGICGGTLITERFVLTSAQCSRSFSRNDIKMVRLGGYNLNNTRDCIKLEQFDTYECNEIQEFEVEEDIRHPFFNDQTFINDIALFRLNKNVIFSDYVRPICLPRSEADLGNYGETLYITGFGDVDRNIKGPRIKKKIRTTLISLETCKEKMNLLSVITPFTPYRFCTEDFKNSTDVTCKGDQGGPVMRYSKLRWFIAGISSTYSCRDDREPQTHLNVFKYMKWIKLNINPLTAKHRRKY